LTDLLAPANQHVARQLARRVGYLYIDSGAMYRAVALLARRMGVPLTEPDQIAALARAARLRFEIGGGSDDEGDDSADSSDYQRVLLNDEDVTAAIRTPEITRFRRPFRRSPECAAHWCCNSRRWARGGEL
jgi:cytidylate kinase